MAHPTSSWQSRAAAKREAIAHSIPEKWRLASIPPAESQRDVTGAYVHQFLTAREVEMTETDALGIVEKTTSGAWTAAEVVGAFCHRASLAHQFVSCLHETFFEAAMADARALDEYLARHGKPKGPLHGLPVSLKDQFHVRDVETTMGYVGWIGTFEGARDEGRARKLESEMVRELRQLGAVLYVKTSVPHTLMAGETVNNIIGCTWNPRNRHLGPGGSSGGEGALIAFGGSPAGFGTDIGGSVRIPAASCGLCGLRPTSGRLPYAGVANSMDGQNSVLSVVGPLATSARSLTLLTKAVLGAEPWLHDPLVAEMPWRADVAAASARLAASQRLAVGLLAHDGTVAPHPPIQRALAHLGAVLTAAGHRVVPWQPPHDLQARICRLVYQTWVYDGGKDCLDAFALSGEPISAQVRPITGDGTMRPQADATAIAATNRDLRRVREEYLDYWNDMAVDCVVAPVAPFTAARPGRYVYYAYSMFVNGLDLPAAVVPVTQVDKGLDGRDESYEPLNALDAEVQADYDPDLYHGAPVALQIIGRRFQEEKVLAIAEWLEAEIKKTHRD